MMQRINNFISPTRAGRHLLAIQVILSGCLACNRSPESVRATFADCFTEPDGLARLREFAKERTGPDELAEIVSLLYTFSLPLERRNLANSFYDANPNSGNSLLARATFHQNSQTRIKLYSDYAAAHPFDFLPYCRVAYTLSITKGGTSKGVEEAIQKAEALTDYHPVSILLRAHQYRNVLDSEPDRLERIKKGYTYFKLHEYAVRLIEKSFIDSEYLSEVRSYLKKRGITPPEPTPEQYAAVKKRGWTFNKQMLEPFKKVD